MPFDFDSLSTDGIETIKIWYHKDYPYSYDIISKTTIVFSNGATATINQQMLSLDHYVVDVVFVSDGLTYEVSSATIDEEKIHSYNRNIKQAYDQKDFWREVEL